MYQLSEADREIQARARAFVREELIPHEEYAEMHGGRLPSGLQETLHARVIELGLGAMNMPKELGGGGYTYQQQTLISEQIGAVTNGLGWVVWTPPNWILDIATPHQLDTWIVPTIEGKRSECYAITEEGAGSDVDAIESTAARNGDDYVLNGVKWHVTSYNHADYVFFQGKLPQGEHALFFVDIDTPGITVDRTPAYSHTYSHHHPIVRFADVRVPAANLVGEEGGGMQYAHAWFRYERLMIAARCCGAAERLIDAASTFAKERIAYGQPIAEYQAIQFMLADSITELWAARLMTYETAREFDAEADVKLQHSQCSMAKLFASEMANRVADRAVQIFGGRGYMRENVAERFFRELRVDRIWEGTSEIHRLIIAAQLLKRGSDLIG
ncbi:MAG TPA: acyl-CoA dehydrogenase family protein [Acidobacteriota bacterium]|nr:acyl-CoA dehydrogenase family protein [Acidobacteriota bacterium]